MTHSRTQGFYAMFLPVAPSAGRPQKGTTSTPTHLTCPGVQHSPKTEIEAQ